MKTREERMHACLYSNDGRVEQCERICKLEELVQDMDVLLVLVGAPTAAYGPWSDIRKQMTELGIEGKEVNWYEP